MKGNYIVERSDQMIEILEVDAQFTWRYRTYV